MNSLFYPQSVAVIGVSEVTGNVGSLLLNNIVNYGFPGTIHAIGKGGGTIGDRIIYNSVLDVPGPIDLASVLVPAAVVPEIIEECGKKGVKWVVIMSAGFTETSDEKHDAEIAIKATANRYGIRIIGPNCVGNFCAQAKLANFFVAVPGDRVRAGAYSIIAQSGSISVEPTIRLSSNRIGISKSISIGNKLQTNEAEVLNYLTQDDRDTEAVGMYLESISDGRGLYEVAKKSPKPIVLLKSNIVPGGSIAAKSHTGALATDDAMVETMCRQTGIVRARTYSQFYSFAKAFKMPPMKGRNVGIVVNSGGAGVVLSDNCYLHGFNIATLPKTMLAKIETMTRTKAIRRGNPLDLGDTYDRTIILHAVEAMLQLPEIDGVFACLANTALSSLSMSPQDLYGQLWKLSLKFQKPVALSIQPLMGSFEELQSELDFPLFAYPEESVEALAASRDYWLHRARPTESPTVFSVKHDDVAETITYLRANNQQDLGPKAFDVLRSYGIAVAAPILATNEAEAIAAAEKLGYPVALKIASPQISHKTDVGGVALNLKTREDVGRGFDSIIKAARAHRPDAQIHGVTVQKMVNEGQEVIVGGRRDPQFGPVIMFGLGGILVELFKDTSFRFAPLTRSDTRDMIEEIKSSQLLRGFRGQPPADIDSLIETIQRISQLMVDFPDVSEVDINPLMVFPAGNGCLGVDVRMFLTPTASSDSQTMDEFNTLTQSDKDD